MIPTASAARATAEINQNMIVTKEIQQLKDRIEANILDAIKKGNYSTSVPLYFSFEDVKDAVKEWLVDYGYEIEEFLDMKGDNYLRICWYNT